MNRAKPGELMRFLKWAIQQETDDCIFWPHACHLDGYPAITIRRKSYRAIRVICTEVYGVPAPAMQAAHSCGNRKCVNKRHLRWASPKENSDDKVQHGTMACGERSNLATITEETVLEIRARKQRPIDIAREFGLTQQHVKQIRNGYTWKHLPLNLEAKDAWRPPKDCAVSGCKRSAYGRGLCAVHRRSRTAVGAA